ncbi:hypothetical protein F2P81_013227 [Scophthalmus maximus]|uniref:Uncharacterized protein n=1 Tax=Scophthalmus maximus TaxID=52904 RepID=A0A6A4SS15_SCOMX|nr:hypothetical protein F2P81_013227 [Scophthalmus maximus]
MNPPYWSKVHLSESLGMPILSQLFWHTAYVQLGATAPKTPDPRVVVKGEAILPRRSNPFEWTLVGQGKKLHHLRYRQQGYSQ